MTTLYWAPRTRSLRAAWMLEELGIDYDIHRIDLNEPQSRKDPGFMAASPLGKVPAVADDRSAVADSTALCLYLADRHSEAGLAPAVDAPERGPYLFWIGYAGSVLEPVVAESLAGIEPQQYRNGWGNMERALGAMTDHLKDRDWVLGDRFSAADVMLGSTVVFFRMFGVMPVTPVLEAYGDRCRKRPAYARAEALEPPPSA